MIRVYWTQDTGKDGGVSLQVYGHGRSDVCAAVSALLNGILATVTFMAKKYPREIRVIKR